MDASLQHVRYHERLRPGAPFQDECINSWLKLARGHRWESKTYFSLTDAVGSAHAQALKMRHGAFSIFSYALKSHLPQSRTGLRGCPYSTKTSSTTRSNVDNTSEKKSRLFVDTFQPVINVESRALASEFAVCVVAVARLQLDFPGARRTRRAFVTEPTV